MEKIYMEDSSTRSSKKKLNLSVVLSFAVAIFAIFSLAVCGISQITYAAPDDGTLSFFSDSNGSGQSYQYINGCDATVGNTSCIDMPYMYRDNDRTNPVFCVQYQVGIPGNGTTYTMGDVINDDGIFYILNNGYYNSNFLNNLVDTDDNPLSEENARFIRYYATQAAIWLYMNDVYPNDPNNSLVYDGRSVEGALRNVALFSINHGNSSFESVRVKYDVKAAIQGLVESAKTYDQSTLIKFNNASPSLSLAEGNDFYQSDEISITATSNLTSYSIALTGLEGAYAVNSAGEVIESGTPLSSNVSFWIRVPKNKVTETAQTINIKATGLFNLYSGNYYLSGDNQKIVSVNANSTPVTANMNLEVIGAPDTAMTTAQTIYFIGLVVLLCGVGIVYANAKPSEIKQ